MKTRSNMPLFVVETNNVKALSNSQIDLLRCGDYLVKKDASGEHAYKVTFKSDTGMCITYHDAYCVETQSYDKVDGNWVYNSEDKTIIAEPQMENIVDGDGHKRFVDGEITYINQVEGMECVYNKWSLSGTHLMVVFALKTNDALNLTSGTYGSFQLPAWVHNKIVAIQGSNIAQAKVLWWDNSQLQTQDGLAYIQKSSDTIYIYVSAVNLTSAKTGRIAFDLLIDNE